MMTRERYQAAIAAFDKANAQDPNTEMADGKKYPEELLYAKRMREAGYSDDMIARVKNIVSKKGLKTDPETQMMEDVVDLVFLEHYMAGFAAQHPEYDEAKWIQIIRKTWQKVSPNAHEFALANKIKLPEALVPLILK